MIRKLWPLFRHCWLGEFLRSLVPDSVVNYFWHLPVALLTVIFFRYPSWQLKVIGVTGTDGKTTTANLIYHLLTQAGKKAALISTVSAKIGEEEIPTGFHVTSPHPWKLQGFLRKIADRGCEYLVLEVTSHGLAQYRIFGVNFLMGVITNVTREHLDYHRTYEDYLKTKARLFRGVKIAVLNKDDESYEYLATKLSSYQAIKLITYGIKNQADFTPKNFKFRTSLPGEYNQYNCLAAIAVTKQLGISDEEIKKGVASFQGVVGRMEEIDEGQDFEVFVDFAHTPNALERALTTLRKSLSPKTHPASPCLAGRQATGGLKPKLIAVFGCAGLRDREKRPVMGEIAAKFANLIVLTAEDPRTEDVNEIIDQIAEGCLEGGAKEKNTSEVERKKKPVFYRIPDRREAIRFAIQKLAQKGDLVVICGKGHEQSMCFGKTEYPWSDQKEVRKALLARLKDGS